MKSRRDIALFTGTISLAISLLVFLGWFFDVRTLKSILPGYITMKFNTALCFAILAGSLILLRDRATLSEKRKWIGFTFAAVVIAICTATLFQYLTGHDLGIDELILKDPDGSGRFPAGRLAPITAFNFIAMSISFLTITSHRRLFVMMSQVLGVMVLFASFQGLVGYIIGVTYLFGSAYYTQMAVHTAFSFVLLSVGRLSVDSDRGFFKSLTATSPTSKMMRAMLLSAIIAPPLVQWLSLRGVSAELIDRDFAQLIQVVGITAIMATITLVSGSALFNSESTLIDQKTKIRDDEEKFRALVDASAQIVWTTDETGANFEDSPSWRAYTGQTTEQWISEARLEAIHPHDHGRTTQAWQRAIQSKKPFQLEYRIKHSSGEWRWAQARGTPVLNSSGAVTAWIGMITDVNERKQIELDLKAAKHDAERANELKSEFLANMSHEIRTPLGAMIGFTDLLRDLSLDVNHRSKYVETIARNGQQLIALVEDILDLSKIESGRLTVHAHPMNPSTLVKECVRALRPNAELKRVELVFEADSSSPDLIVTDSGRARQILMNMISNAIKFTSAGRVIVRVRGWKESKANRGGKFDGVEFEIEDSGIGILESQKGHIFEMFVQADGSLTRRHGGTGLGLSLSRRLAKELGGDVYLKSTTPGHGSIFIVQLADRTEEAMTQPAPKQETKPSTPAAKPVPLNGISVLIVDDAPDNRDLIAHHLRKHGASTGLAENGLEGYQLAMKESFDIVLMDLQMPVLDGYAATQRLRSEGFTKPIIALTAHAMTEVRQKCLDVGCTDHLAKPVDFGVLTRKIDRFVRINKEPKSV